MPAINVAKAFNLIITPGSEKLHFEPGVHDVTESVAEHWYTQEHLVEGGESLAKKARAAADAAFRTADAAVKEYQGLEAAARAAEIEVGLEPPPPAHVRLLAADEGDDELPGNDTITGNDALTASVGTDALLGGQGADSLVSEAGNDTIDAAPKAKKA